MGDVVLIVVAVVVAGAAGTGAAAMVGMRFVRGKVRLPGGPRVPLRWAVSPRAHAHLHRRLRRLDRAAAALTPRRRRRRTPALPSHELARQVRDAARTLDAELVHLSRLHPSARRTHLTRVRADVVHLERSTAQLHTLVAPTPTDVAGLATQVDTFAATFHELDAGR